MNRKLVVFGTTTVAELAFVNFTDDSDHEVVAFTADAHYISEPSFCGLPLVPFADVATLYPPDSHDFFVAVGYSQLNAVRRETCQAAKALGYRLSSYVSSTATVRSEATVGENAFILDHVTVAPFATLGDGVMMWDSSHVGHHSTVGDFCFVATNASISGRVTLGEQVFIGTNATVRDNITIGWRCVVGAGTLLLSDAEPDGVYIGSASPRAAMRSSDLRSI